MLIGMKKVTFLLFASLCTYMCFLGLILSLKKPLCIDSSIVQRIDMVKSSVATTAYACAFHKDAVYSLPMESYISKVNPYIEKTFRLLDAIKPFKNKITLIVNEDRPYVFQIEKNRINLGSHLAESETFVTRAIVKAWVNENKTALSVDTRIVEETVADFLMYVLLGKVDIEDPVDKVRTKLGSVKWPQVIKTPKGYCKSAWKYSEHIEDCLSSNSNDNFEGDLNSVVFGLRPLFTTAWIASYNDLTWKQKQQVVQSTAAVLNGMYLSSDKIIDSLAKDNNPLHLGITNINKFTELIQSVSNSKNISLLPLYAGLGTSLQNLGVTDAFAEAYFDYLVEYSGQIDQSSEFFKNIEQASIKNPDVQVALKDKHAIWILPSKTALPLSVFNQVKSRQTIYIGCHLHKSTKIDQFFQKTEKLMLINECENNNQYNFVTLFSNGIREFVSSKQSSKFNFVQLHIPSFEMVHKDLDPEQNLFELVKGRDINKREFKVLGWTQINWKQDIGAYRPEAVIDAIEYFRN